MITDLRMPKVTGLEVINAAKKVKTPVIITTAYTKEYTHNIPKDIKIVRKPFNIECLMKEIDQTVNKKALEAFAH